MVFFAPLRQLKKTVVEVEHTKSLTLKPHYLQNGAVMLNNNAFRVDYCLNITYRERSFTIQIVQQMFILIHNLFYPFPEKLNLTRRENGEPNSPIC